MYLKLFNRATNAIRILQDGQLEGETAYTESDDEPILIIATDEEPPDSN